MSVDIGILKIVSRFNNYCAKTKYRRAENSKIFLITFVIAKINLYLIVKSVR